jgi:hypothetical protein
VSVKNRREKGSGAHDRTLAQHTPCPYRNWIGMVPPDSQRRSWLASTRPGSGAMDQTCHPDSREGHAPHTLPEWQVALGAPSIGVLESAKQADLNHLL